MLTFEFFSNFKENEVYYTRSVFYLDYLQHDVQQFMQKADQLQPDKPTMPSEDVKQLRVNLIYEELTELRLALKDNDLVEAYDAIIDLLVVTIGTANALGMRLQPGWDEVHRSNMSKFIDGHKREDGKWVKGPSYSPAELKPIIEEQLKGKENL